MRTLPADHPTVQAVVQEYAVLLRKTGRAAEAAALEARSVIKS